MNEAYRQLEAAGYLNYLSFIEDTGEKSIEGWAVRALIPELRKDARFIETPWHFKHAHVGPKRVDFRGRRGEFGEGAMQFVISQATDRCHVDVDRWSPIDLVGMVMHYTVDVWKWRT